LPTIPPSKKPYKPRPEHHQSYKKDVRSIDKFFAALENDDPNQDWSFLDDDYFEEVVRAGDAAAANTLEAQPGLALQLVQLTKTAAKMAYELPSAIAVTTVIVAGMLAAWAKQLNTFRADFFKETQKELKDAAWFNPPDLETFENDWIADEDEVPEDDARLASLASELGTSLKALRNASAVISLANDRVETLTDLQRKATDALGKSQKEVRDLTKAAIDHQGLISDLQSKINDLQLSADPANVTRLQLLESELELQKDNLEIALRAAEKAARAFKASRNQLMSSNTADPAVQRRLINSALAILRATPRRTVQGIPPPTSEVISDLGSDFGVTVDVPPANPADPDFPPEFAPGSDKFLESKPPFEFDGNVKVYNEWVMELRMHVDSNRGRFRNRGHVLNMVTASTKPGSRAKTIMETLSHSILAPGTDENDAWRQLTKAPQTLSWIITCLDPTFKDHLSHRFALTTLMKLRQGSSYFSTFFLEMNALRMRLQWNTQTILPHLINGTNPLVLVNIATRASKLVDELTYADFEKYGTVVDYDLRTSGQLKRETAPTVKRLAIAAAPVSNERDAPTKRKCGRVTSYSQNKVPQAAQGSLYAGASYDTAQLAAARSVNEYCRRHNLCAACRTPQHEHSAVQPGFLPVKEFRTFAPRALPAPISGPRITDVTDEPAPRTAKTKTD
jgi:hypothetical protein